MYDLHRGTFTRPRKVIEEKNIPRTDGNTKTAEDRNGRTTTTSQGPLPSYSSSSEFSSSDDEVVAQLAQELIEYTSPTPSEAGATPIAPIPLLTPPASPIPIRSDESGQPLIEWPSNLAVDNALTAASKLHPLSLSSLVQLEEDNECEEPFVILFPKMYVPGLE